ncbi:ATP-binding protein [Sphingosinicella sp. CPCC 101087]|uniref:ATP-binding protein n=1 Tax=Sphingosinicella sp. CPCC 101087 TaxID=2497754 RepID=UPI00101DAB0D|nr:ATP-binding protein [Sphingosinicella sp. CPCC 101087]
MSDGRLHEISELKAGQRTRLLIGLFAAFVLVLVVLAPIQRIQVERREAVEAAIRQNENRAIMLEQYLTRTLEAANIATLHLAERFVHGEGGLSHGTLDRPARIGGPIAGNPSFLGVSLVDADGNLVASTLGTRVAGTNVRNHPAFRIHVQQPGDRLFVSVPAFSRRLGREVIWLTRRIEREDGSFAGVAAINIAPEQLIGFHDGVSVRPSDIISVIGLDGITRARITGGQISAGEDLRGTLAMRRQEADPDGTYLGPGALDGKIRFFSHRRLEDYPLFATYGVLRDDVLRPARQRARLIVAVAALVAVITIAFALVLISLLRRRDRWTAETAEANRRLEEAQRIARVGDWDFDLETGRISWSPQLYEMYGRDPASGPPTLAEFEAMLDEDSRLVVAEAITEAIVTGEPQVYELRAKTAGGAESHRLISAIPTRNGEGRVVRMYGTDQDISDRKRMDQLEAELSHLSRVEAMNAMAATLAHELNQPLAAAANFLVGSRKILSSGKGDREDAAEGLRAAQHQVQFAGEIIRRVRAMVSNDPKELRSVPIARIIDDAIALGTMGTKRDGIDIRKRIGANAAFVVADRIQIQQVLLNLIRNAREAVATAEKPAIMIRSSRADANHVTITVEDNGSGFGADSASMFTAFSSGKAQGLGLGLSISRTIIESHGGRIWIENLPTGGARVSFTLPGVEPEAN